MQEILGTGGICACKGEREKAPESFSRDIARPVEPSRYFVSQIYSSVNFFAFSLVIEYFSVVLIKVLQDVLVDQVSS